MHKPNSHHIAIYWTMMWQHSLTQGLFSSKQCSHQGISSSPVIPSVQQRGTADVQGILRSIRGLRGIPGVLVFRELQEGRPDRRLGHRAVGHLVGC